MYKRKCLFLTKKNIWFDTMQHIVRYNFSEFPSRKKEMKCMCNPKLIRSKTQIDSWTNKWLSLWVSHCIIHSVNSFRNKNYSQTPLPSAAQLSHWIIYSETMIHSVTASSLIWCTAVTVVALFVYWQRKILLSLSCLVYILLNINSLLNCCIKQ